MRLQYLQLCGIYNLLLSTDHIQFGRVSLLLVSPLMVMILVI